MGKKVLTEKAIKGKSVEQCSEEYTAYMQNRKGMTRPVQAFSLGELDLSSERKYGSVTITLGTGDTVTDQDENIIVLGSRGVPLTESKSIRPYRFDGDRESEKLRRQMSEYMRQDVEIEKPITMKLPKISVPKTIDRFILFHHQILTRHRKTRKRSTRQLRSKYKLVRFILKFKIWKRK